MADAQVVYDAGFSEERLLNILPDTAPCNVLNRILGGAGIKAHVRMMEMCNRMRRLYRTHLWKMISKGAG
jgi:hypothetical protein